MFHKKLKVYNYKFKYDNIVQFQSSVIPKLILQQITFTNQNQSTL